MQSRLLTNLFLLLLVIGLAAFLFNNEDQQDKAISLSNVAADNIQQISIHHHKRDINLSKSAGQWQMTAPIEIMANQFRIKTLLNLLTATSHAQYNIENIKLEKFGFAETDTKISFNQLEISFGITNPLNNLRYVRIDNKMHLIDDHFYPLLSSQIGTLITRELIPAGSKISKLVLPEQTLALDENGLWKSTTDISADAITETIYQWSHKQAFAIHDYMPRGSLGNIQVYIENNETPVEFRITNITPWLIIARPDLKLEYHFNLEDYDALLNPGSKKVTDEKPADNQSLQVSPDEFINSIQQSQ
ncbi:MAG: DUF4340 domain-containing protein [Gammaproteobacteria bacterium]|nr:DUF4340 domain-containing protein [Gammaproteobacteria bacterium]